MKLIIYMPAYNEETNVPRVIAELPRFLEGMGVVEYLVVDDGSTDRTAQVARAAGAQVVSHTRNRGVGAAFASAVQFALEEGADILVSIDADGQFDAAEIPMLLGPILSGQADMVIGSRFKAGIPENMPRVKYWGNMQVANIINYVSGQQFRDVSCGFRAYSREVLLRMNLFGSFTYTHETILSTAYQGLRVVECPISVKYFPERKSKVAGSILQYAFQTSKIIFRAILDYRPMRFFGTLAWVLMVVGLVFVLYMLGHYAITGSYTPFKSFGFIGLSFFVFGILVFLVAFIADMINRVRVNEDRVLYELKKMKYDTPRPEREATQVR